VIPQRELAALRAEWTLDQGVIERDYILGWLLAGIATHDSLNRTWIFKGGTCLRKCYYETFRFSEDLDFTIVDGGPEEPEELTRIFGEIASWLREESGIELVLGGMSFRRQKNSRDRPTTRDASPTGAERQSEHAQGEARPHLRRGPRRPAGLPGRSGTRTAIDSRSTAC